MPSLQNLNHGREKCSILIVLPYDMTGLVTMHESHSQFFPFNKILIRFIPEFTLCTKYLIHRPQYLPYKIIEFYE